VNRRAKEAANHSGKRKRSKYAGKNRGKEIAQGWSPRPASPFYLSPEEVKRLRAAARVAAPAEQEGGAS